MESWVVCPGGCSFLVFPFRVKLSLLFSPATLEAKQRGCKWLCGFVQGDIDPATSAPVRWAYGNSKGAACWKCERVWQTLVAHTTPDRNRTAHQLLMSKDREVHERFQQLRRDFELRLKDNAKFRLRKEGARYVAMLRATALMRTRIFVHG